MDRGDRRRQRAGDPLGAATRWPTWRRYFTELAEYRRRHPGDDAVSELVQAGDAAGVSTLDVIGFAFTMVTGGNDTTTGLLGGALELLAAAPDQRARLVARPGGDPRRGRGAAAADLAGAGPGPHRHA